MFVASVKVSKVWGRKSGAEERYKIHRVNFVKKFCPCKNLHFTSLVGAFWKVATDPINKGKFVTGHILHGSSPFRTIYCNISKPPWLCKYFHGNLCISKAEPKLLKTKYKGWCFCFPAWSLMVPLCLLVILPHRGQTSLRKGGKHLLSIAFFIQERYSQIFWNAMNIVKRRV